MPASRSPSRDFLSESLPEQLVFYYCQYVETGDRLKLVELLDSLACAREDTENVESNLKKRSR